MSQPFKPACPLIKIVYQIVLSHLYGFNLPIYLYFQSIHCTIYSWGWPVKCEELKVGIGLELLKHSSCLSGSNLLSVSQLVSVCRFGTPK